METQFRPYSKILTLGSTSTSSVTLADTGDTAFACNFVSVACSGSNNAYFTVQYDADNVTTPLANQSKPCVLGDTSGITGGIAKTNGGVVELLLADNDRPTSVTISQSDTQDRLYMITYGQIQSGNPLRDNERPVGS